MTLVFYDGVCGLCNHFIRFLLSRDRRERLRFAPLQGDVARRTLVPLGHDPADLDTIYVVAGWGTAAARVLRRSRAVLPAVGELGRGWKVIVMAARLLPRGLSDTVYTAIARRRYRLFGQLDACPLPRPEWRGRFIE